MAHRIVLVDDHEVVRKGLGELISTNPKFEMVGYAASAPEALDVVVSTRPDLVVADLILGDGPDGIQLTKGIKAHDPMLPVLVLSGRDESLFAERALLAGAAGYVMKDDAIDVLFEAMETAIDGGVWLSRAMSERLLPKAVLNGVDGEAVTDEFGQALVTELRRGNRTVTGIARALGRPQPVVERGLDLVQDQLRLPSRAALYLYLR